MPTAIVVNLMSSGLLVLILWCIQGWKALMGMDNSGTADRPPGGQRAAYMSRTVVGPCTSC